MMKKSKMTVFFLLLICGLFFVVTTVMLDFGSILKGKNLKQLLAPFSFLFNAYVLIYIYIDKKKEENKY